ncbi:hypothetical protein V8C37DRAFT_415294 [Trichoderma ceciliae]
MPRNVGIPPMMRADEQVAYRDFSLFVLAPDHEAFFTSPARILSTEIYRTPQTLGSSCKPQPNKLIAHIHSYARHRRVAHRSRFLNPEMPPNKTTWAQEPPLRARHVWRIDLREESGPDPFRAGCTGIAGPESRFFSVSVVPLPDRDITLMEAVVVTVTVTMKAPAEKSIEEKPLAHDTSHHVVKSVARWHEMTELDKRQDR